MKQKDIRSTRAIQEQMYGSRSWKETLGSQMTAIYGHVLARHRIDRGCIGFWFALFIKRGYKIGQMRGSRVDGVNCRLIRCCTCFQSDNGH